MVLATLSQADNLLDLTTRKFSFKTYIKVYFNNTLGRLYLHPIFQELLQKARVQSIRQLHPSLNCEERVTALLTRAKLLRYPAGLDLAGKYINYYLL
jgi:hypothetical protein